MADKPLNGYRVLDLSRILAGPWASQVLADLGADVIKIERPGTGDDTRHWGPPFLKDRTGKETGTAAYFLSANRGKRSVTVDFSTPPGQRVLRDLAKTSDILIENFVPGGLARFGLDYATLAQENPKLVYCSITGFGQTGPYRDRTGYDLLIQGMGGMMSITGEKDERAGGGPQRAGVAITDLCTGLYAAIAIEAALLERATSGRGQHIDLSLLDSQVAMLANQAANYLVGGDVPGRLGNEHPNIVPYQVFETSDGHFILAIGNNEQFRRFARATGLEHLAADARYGSNAGRVRHRVELCEEIRKTLMQKPASDWLDCLQAAGVPCGPINAIDAVFDDPQIKARDMRLNLPHEEAGTVALVANPIRYSRSNAQAESAPPALGEHTEEVLSGVLGYNAQTIASLKAQRAI